MSKRTFFGLIALLLILALIVWIVVRKNKDKEQAITTPLLSVYAQNQTKNVSAVSAAAAPDDIVAFTLTAENQTDIVVPGFVIEANISEVTDKSTLIDAGGASYNSATNSLVWTPLDIQPKGLIQKQFSVRVNPLPSGSTNTVMKIKFNNQLDVVIQPIQSPTQVAGANTQNFKAPVTGSAGEISIWLAMLATATLALAKKYRLIKS